MEHRPKALLVRSPGMGSLRYIITNLNGTMTLVIPEESKPVRHFLVEEAAAQNGYGRETGAIEIDMDELLSIVERLEVAFGEGN